MTIAFYLQANGETEQVIRIQVYLSIFCINNPSSWSNALKKAEFVYNNWIHADCTQTLFELIYGEAPKAIPKAFSHSQHPSAQARINQLWKWRQEAFIMHQYAQERMKTQLKENYKPFFKEQKVWLEATNLWLNYNKKITTKREEPFQILEVLPPVNYWLKLPEKWKTHNVFHTSLLTLYYENQVHRPNFSRPPPDIIDNEEEFEVYRMNLMPLW